MTANLGHYFKNIFLARKIGILNKITNNIGKCEIINDRVICKVNNDILVQNSRDTFNYCLNLRGIEDDVKEEIKNLLGYTRNFKIIYIIDEMIFEKTLYLSCSNDTEVIFKKCSFNEEIDILCGNNIIFNNCKYYDFQPTYYSGESYFNVSSMVNRVSFINNNYVNVSDEKATLGMSINCRELEFINSVIKPNDYSSSYIDVDKLNIINSKVIGKDINIEAKVINNIDSEFIGDDVKVKKIGR